MEPTDHINIGHINWAKIVDHDPEQKTMSAVGFA